ncbi:hypothetical protein QVD17_19193 [Tagetes erecta]|uniref:Uncharacterized protein n=1 Tax=Tagetes erecta TaxID=13708 RepID=A0AAD8KJ28_TARER|nr:hypothetical protein QVD17_19193 [Tagetes erecta]
MLRPCTWWFTGLDVWLTFPFLELITKMATEKTQPPAATPPAMDSCRKKKSDDATFLQDVKDHIDEFVHASMDEHKTCFKKTISKMFGMSKIVAERNAAAESKEIESSLPLHTILSE